MSAKSEAQLVAASDYSDVLVKPIDGIEVNESGDYENVESTRLLTWIQICLAGFLDIFFQRTETNFRASFVDMVGI